MGDSRIQDSHEPTTNGGEERLRAEAIPLRAQDIPTQKPQAAGAVIPPLDLFGTIEEKPADKAAEARGAEKPADKAAEARGAEKPADKAAEARGAEKPTDKAAEARAAEKPGDRALEAKVGERPPAKGLASERAVPAEKVVEARVADKPLERPVVLTADELARAGELRDTLVDMLPSFSQTLVEPRGQNEALDVYRQRVARETESLRRQIREDRGFGDTTRRAYQAYIQWMERGTMGLVASADRIGVPLPPGAPVTLPADQNQRVTAPELYRAMLASGQGGRFTMGLDSQRVPTMEEIDRMDSVLRWIRTTTAVVDEASQQHQAQVLTGRIREMGLPQGWHRAEGDSREAWLASASQMVELAVTTRNHIEMMQHLYRSSADGSFPVSLPPGTTLTIENSGRPTTVTTETLAQNLSLLRTGTITGIRLDLPEDLRQSAVANQNRIERMQEWLRSVGPGIDRAVENLTRAQENPDAVIMYGDQEIRNGRGRFDAQNRFVGIAGPDYVAREGETLREINLVGYDFQVDRMPNGRYRVTQSIQAHDAPVYAYQNARFLVNDVGARMNLPPQFLDGNDFVPVRSGGRVEMVRVRDLASLRRSQALSYWADKTLSTTMDAAMLVSGTIELGAAVRAAGLAGRAVNPAVRLAGGEAAWQITQGAVRVGVAGAGILNNAGGRSWEVGGYRLGEGINQARSAYFLGDTAIGLGRAAYGLRQAESATRTLTASERVQQLINESGVPGLARTHALTHLGFKASELGFVPVLGSELAHQIREARRIGERDAVGDALEVARERGARPGSVRQSGEARPITAETLTEYSRLLGRGLPRERQQAIDDIFSRARAAMRPGNEAERTAFIHRALASVSFTGDEVRRLEQAYGDTQSRDFRLGGEDLRDLLNPARSSRFPAAVRAETAAILGARNNDEVRAYRLALLAVSQQANSFPALQLTVPAYDRAVAVGVNRQGERQLERITVPEGQVQSAINPADVVAMIRRDFETSSGGAYNIAAADLLHTTGRSSSQQYGSVLQDVLRRSTSADERMSALVGQNGARFGGIVRDMTRAALTGENQGRGFGVSVRDMVATLEHTARNDSTPAVRAMAAGQLFARGDEATLAELVRLWRAHGTSNEFAGQVSEYLRRQMTAAIPQGAGREGDNVRERRIDAAIALSRLTPEGNREQQAAITRSLVESFSTTNPTLALRVMQNLSPGQIAQLGDQDRDRFLRSAVGWTRRPPGDFADEPAYVGIIERTSRLLQGQTPPALRDTFNTNLTALLTPGAAIPAEGGRPEQVVYASFFPDIRIAAINALAEQGASPSTLETIRRHMAASQQPPRTGRGEPDASVRHAAIQALVRLRDPELPTAVASLIRQETDMRTAQLLRDTAITQNRPEPTSAEYQQRRQSIADVVINPPAERGFPHLARFGQQQGREWLDTNFPLLNITTFRQRAQREVDNATSGVANLAPWRSREDIQVMEMQAATRVADQRTSQWNELRQMARGTGEDADRARRTLLFIATTPMGSMLGESNESAGLRSDYDRTHMLTGIRNADFRTQAAQALAATSSSNHGVEMNAHYVESALTTTSGLSGAARQSLLEGLLVLGRGQGGIGTDRVAQTLTRALEVELRRPRQDQDQAYQSSIVQELRRLQYRPALPVLDAVSRSSFESVRTEAQQAVRDWRGAVGMVWTQTPQDNTSTAGQRAERLQRALTEGSSSRVVEELFAAYRGQRLRDGDPGVAPLQQALQDSSEPVRLAAARILVASDLSEPAKNAAVRALSQIAVTSGDSRYRSESLGLLRENVRGPVSVTGFGQPPSLYEISGAGNEMRIVESIDGRQVGWVYPNGESMRVYVDTSGTLTSFVENGVEYRRQQSGGTYTDRWLSTDGRTWSGRYELLENGSYWYQTANQPVRWTRGENGSWSQSTVPWQTTPVARVSEAVPDAPVTPVAPVAPVAPPRPSTTESYESIRERVQTDVVNPAALSRYPHLRDFTQQQAREFIDRSFPLLNSARYRAAAQTAVDNATGSIANLGRSEANINIRESRAALAVGDQRMQQWRSLVSLAGESGADGDRARMALFYITTSGVGDMLGEGSTAAGVRSRHNPERIITSIRHPDWSTMAAQALAAGASSGHPARDMTAHSIESALSTPGLAARPRMELLEGLRRLGSGESGISREATARTLTRALEIELRRPQADQSEEFQRAILDDLRRMQYRLAVPILDGISRSRFESVRNAASGAIREMRDSVVPLWNEAVPDQRSSAVDRAARVRESLTNSQDVERTIREIFTAYKGYNLTDGDPGMPVLQSALSHSNERVRLAAARALIQSGLDVNHPAKRHAVSSLVELGLTTGNQNYRLEAQSELANLTFAGAIDLQMEGNRRLRLERVDNRVRVTEFVGGSQVGWIYPNGESMRVQRTASGEVVRVVENGVEYRRRSSSGSYLNEWENGSTRQIWSGRYDIGRDGSYWYQATGRPTRYQRAQNGAWSSITMPIAS